MPVPKRRPRSNAGFTLVELAVVVGVLGLLAMTMASTFDSAGQARQHNAAQAHAESARQALRAFALRNKRLPCPDGSTFGDSGREAAGGSCSGGTNVGWLPYEALGLETPARASRLRYGVYRGAANADLVAPRPSAVDTADLEGSGGFIAALARAAASPPTTGQPHYIAGIATGNAPPCAGGGAGTTTVNPAFVLVAPVADRDGLGGTHPNFDGDHRAFAEGSTRCVAPPGYPGGINFDDVVVAESHTTLLGWVMTVTR